MGFAGKIDRKTNAKDYSKYTPNISYIINYSVFPPKYTARGSCELSNQPVQAVKGVQEFIDIHSSYNYV